MENIPEGFFTIINDFVNDIKSTFPEYDNLIKKFWNLDYSDSFLYEFDESKRDMLIVQSKNDSLTYIYNHCKRVFPERFFDILYQNIEIFKEESEVNTEFLPRIVFKHLWNSDISEKTRNTIWKYLQLILFTVVNSIDDKSYLGESENLLQAIGEEDLKAKLQETMEDMQKLFESQEYEYSKSKEGKDNEEEQGESFGPKSMPSVDKLTGHLAELMGGKLGKLAMDMAEDFAKELNLDPNMTNPNDILKKLMKNPAKIMSMVSGIKTKMDEKIKSGEISETELMEEALKMFSSLKENGGGIEQVKAMLSKFGMKMPGNGKVDLNAMESQLKRALDVSKMKDKMKQKSAQKKQDKEDEILLKEEFRNSVPKFTDDELVEAFVDTKTSSKKSKKDKKGKK